MKKTVHHPRQRAGPPRRTPLPRLSVPPRNSQTILTITMIHVYDNPWYRGGEGMQWVTALRPARPVGENDIVCLATNRDRRTGIGRISHISHMDKHWITFGIAGAVPKMSVRIPVPWAALTSKVVDIHTQVFTSLENIPPHPYFRTNPRFLNPNANPYRRLRPPSMQAERTPVTGAPLPALDPDASWQRIEQSRSTTETSQQSGKEGDKSS